MTYETETQDRSLSMEASCCSRSSCCSPETPVIRAEAKVGRNDPCPCDSGKKFKKCCGNNAFR